MTTGPSSAPYSAQQIVRPLMATVWSARSMRVLTGAPSSWRKVWITGADAVLRDSARSLFRGEDAVV